jgi:hypothetical protein
MNSAVFYSIGEVVAAVAAEVRVILFMSIFVSFHPMMTTMIMLKMYDDDGDNEGGYLFECEGGEPWRRFIR